MRSSMAISGTRMRTGGGSATGWPALRPSAVRTLCRTYSRDISAASTFGGSSWAAAAADPAGSATPRSGPMLDRRRHCAPSRRPPKARATRPPSPPSRKCADGASPRPRCGMPAARAGSAPSRASAFFTSDAQLQQDLAECRSSPGRPPRTRRTGWTRTAARARARTPRNCGVRMAPMGPE